MMDVEETLIYILLFLFGVAGFLLIQNATVNLDTSAWTFSGHEFVSIIMPYVSYIYLAVLLLVPTYKIIKEYG